MSRKIYLDIFVGAKYKTSMNIILATLAFTNAAEPSPVSHPMSRPLTLHMGEYLPTVEHNGTVFFDPKLSPIKGADLSQSELGYALKTLDDVCWKKDGEPAMDLFCGNVSDIIAPSLDEKTGEKIENPCLPLYSPEDIPAKITECGMEDAITASMQISGLFQQMLGDPKTCKLNDDYDYNYDCYDVQYFDEYGDRITSFAFPKWMMKP